MSKHDEQEARDFSIDCETLGTRFDAPIISIGVIKFNIDTSKKFASFYREISLDSAIASGTVSGDTLAWWMTQGQKAKKLFEAADKVSLATALHDLTQFFVKHGASEHRVWGNGATADISWLEHAYAVAGVGLTIPWRFWNIRDMRTIVDVASFDASNWPFPNNAIAHNALDDAARQAEIIAAAWQKIRGARPEIKAATAKLPVAPKPEVVKPSDDDEL